MLQLFKLPAIKDKSGPYLHYQYPLSRYPNTELILVKCYSPLNNNLHKLDIILYLLVSHILSKYLFYKEYVL